MDSGNGNPLVRRPPLRLFPWKGDNSAALRTNPGGLYFDNSVRLEPGQFEASLCIPEPHSGSVAGLVPGTTFETTGRRVQVLDSGTYFWRGGRATRLPMAAAGSARSRFNPAPPCPMNSLALSGPPFQERTVSGYVSQLLRAKLDPGTPGQPEPGGTGHGLSGSSSHNARTRPIEHGANRDAGALMQMSVATSIRAAGSPKALAPGITRPMAAPIAGPARGLFLAGQCVSWSSAGPSDRRDPLRHPQSVRPGLSAESAQPPECAPAIVRLWRRCSLIFE